MKTLIQNLATAIIVCCLLSTFNSKAQIITTYAGNGTVGYTGDGGLATNAEINYPYYLKMDIAGNLYFCDLSNYRVRKINTAGIISTIAGTGTCCATPGDGGQATDAEINPHGLAFDATGNLYIADGGNRIRMINTAGIIT